jgi:thiamine-monophosphate kinase
VSAPAPRASEEALIARYFAPLAGPGGLELTDDAAQLSPNPGHDLVLTADAIVAGVHYLADDPPASIARKALGVNLSDLAAKGATPRGFLLTLALQDDWTEAWLAGFAQGLGVAGTAFGCPLLGGDTVRAAGATLIGVTALGEVPAGAMVPRMAAQVGDRICVSGTIGDGALGLRVLQGAEAWTMRLDEGARAHLVDRYRHPRPRLALAPILRRHARAAMDVSDGLAGDLAKMLKGGERGAQVSVPALPLSEAARLALQEAPGLIDTILTGGDDYEILCAVPPDRLDDALAETRAAGVPLTVIGEVSAEGTAPAFAMPDGTMRRFAAGSFSHF